jgi:hypothetical protein
MVDVKACKVYGGKTHDCNVIFQKMLSLIVHNILPHEVVIPLIKLISFFNSICSKGLGFEELNNLSTLIRETLCQLEILFPLSFLYTRMHFPVHLAE